jgi:hypothetical protein
MKKKFVIYELEQKKNRLKLNKLNVVSADRKDDYKDPVHHIANLPILKVHP